MRADEAMRPVRSGPPPGRRQRSIPRPNRVLLVVFPALVAPVILLVGWRERTDGLVVAWTSVVLLGLLTAWMWRLFAGESILQDEGRTAAALLSSLDCVITIDREGRILEFNPSAEQTFGYKKADVIGQPMVDLIVPPSLRDRHRKAFQHHLQTGKSSILGARIETTGMRADGAEFPVELAIARVEDGGPPIFTAYLRDITERRMAEEHLRSSEERLRIALDAAKLGTFAYDVASDREVGDARLAAIFGLRLAEFPQTLGDLLALIHPDDRARVAATLTSTARADELEYRIVRPDGVVRVVQTKSKALIGANGEFVGDIGVAADVTERKEAEERLRLGEERLRLALAAGEMGTWTQDVVTQQESWDETLEAIFGLAPGTFPGTFDAFLEMVHPEDREWVASNDARVSEPRELEYRIVRPDGSIRTLLTRGAAVRDEEGNALRDVGVVVDITERKEAEERLRLSEERLRLALQAAGMGTWTQDVATKAESWDEALEAIFGLAPGTFPGTYDDFLALVHPEDRENVASHGASVTGSRELEYRIIRPDGSVRTVLTRGKVVTDHEGIPLRDVGIGIDITERRKAVDGLRESEERLRFALDAGRMGAWHLDLATMTVTWDTTMRSIFGLPSDAPISSFEDYMRSVHPEDHDRVSSQSKQAMETETAGDLEHRIVWPDGSERWIWTGMRHIRNEGGTVVGLAGIVADITDRKRTEKELESRVLQQVALAGLLQSALSETSVSALMDQATAMLAATFGVEFSKVLELVPERSVLTLVSGVGWNEGTIGTAEVPVASRTQAGQAILSLEPVIVEDLATDPRFSDADFLREHGIVSGVSTPIMSQEGPLGVLGVHARFKRTFGSDDVHFVRSVAAVLADGMERLRSEEELHRTLHILRATDEERRKLLSRLVRVQEEERERIAADIHDDSIQVMTALSIRLQMLRDELTDPEQLARLTELEKVLEKTIGRLRHLLFELRPPALDREGLTTALRDYLQKMSEEDGATYSLDNRLVAEPETDARVIVYRIAQEALVNVRKHARASKVDVRLDEREGGVFVSIQDDGEGFSPDIARVGLPGHLGLTAMRERAEMAGGWLKIVSRPGAGTSVDFWVPAEKVPAEKVQK